MSTEPIKISIDMASIVSLKADVLKKQEEFRLKKALKTKSSGEEYETRDTNTTWGRKRKLDQETKATESVDEKKIKEDEICIEDLALEKSRQMLESKAEYYQQVQSGERNTDEGDDELFLVDFEQKKYEQMTKGKNSDLRKFIIEDEYNKELRTKWEKEAAENFDKSSVRYQDIKYDEIRNMGVGHFQFSRDEIERQKQLDFFKEMNLETMHNRVTNEINKLKKDIELNQRLLKVMQRRYLKHGYSLDEIQSYSEINQFHQEINEMNRETTELENYRDAQADEKSMIDEHRAKANAEPFLPTMRRKIGLDRVWDKPKLKEKFWEKHVANLRMERKKEYAPPKTYDYSKPKKNLNKKKQFSNPPEYYNRPEIYNSINQPTSHAQEQPGTNLNTNPIYSVPPPPLFPPSMMTFPIPTIPQPFYFQTNTPSSSFQPAPSTSQSNDECSDYQACIIGTSMVKYIDPKNVFDSETKCFHKSISGGSIKHIKEALEYHEANLKNVKLFIVTCGSNDCDSTYKDAQAVISLYLNLARTMKKLFPDAKLIFNKLVPRMDTKFSELAVFEQKRCILNRFLESSLPNMVSNCTIIGHDEFEVTGALASLLNDGVHFTFHGVGVYAAQLKRTVDSLGSQK